MLRTPTASKSARRSDLFGDGFQVAEGIEAGSTAKMESLDANIGNATSLFAWEIVRFAKYTFQVRTFCSFHNVSPLNRF